MFGFIRLLTNVVSASNHTKCISLSNQKFEIQSAMIDLHHNEYTQYHPLVVNLDNGTGNILNDLSNKVCVPNKAEDLNLSVFNIIIEINELRTLSRHISCECKCKFDGKKCN